jgi:two-component system response regulator PilR (NtrC family)
MPDCLIVDDEPDICELIALTLDKMGISSKSAFSLYDARQHLERHPFRLCLTDMKLPDGNGIDLVRFTSKQFPKMPIAVITAHGNMDSAIEAMKAGAFDFMQKPVDLNNLRQLVETALKLTEKSETPAIPESDEVYSEATDQGPILIGSSVVMQEIRNKIDRLARTQAPVHISGESGTGKEVAARMIHSRGPRAKALFVPVNCGAIPPELMESEFFGHLKGSFTGAIADKKGLFQEADQGTLFLDEIADLPIPMQVKLLRAIQEKKIRPVGSSREISVDVRIISATHKKLPDLVDSGAFRKDLFYRVHVINLEMPALRDHTEDIPELIDYCFDKAGYGNNKTLTAKAVSQIQNHSFPGNIRELENLLEASLALSDGIEIEIFLNEKPEPPFPLEKSNSSNATLESQVNDFEREKITNALAENRWNRSITAEKLGLTLRQIRYKISKLGISDLSDD